MTTRPYVAVLIVSVVLMVIGAILGGWLESTGTVTRERMGPTGVLAVVLAYAGLLVLAAFAAVPVLLRVFISGQIRAGNGQVAVIRWLQTHEPLSVYCVWAFFAVGLVLALALAGKDMLAHLR